MQRDKNICTWKSFDHAEDYENGVDKKFVTTFENELDAEAFQDVYSKYTLEVNLLDNLSLVGVFTY